MMHGISTRRRWPTTLERTSPNARVLREPQQSDRQLFLARQRSKGSWTRFPNIAARHRRSIRRVLRAVVRNVCRGASSLRPHGNLVEGWALPVFELAGCAFTKRSRQELEKVRQPFNLNTASQEIATLALTDLAPLLEEHITRHRRGARAARDRGRPARGAPLLQKRRELPARAIRGSTFPELCEALCCSSQRSRCGSFPVVIRGSEAACGSPLAPPKRISVSSRRYTIY